MTNLKTMGQRVMLLALMLPGMNLYAQEDERADILAVTEQLFDAVRSGNPDDWRALLLAEGMNISFRPNPDGDAAGPVMYMTQNETFVAGIRKGERVYRERWTSEPVVMIRGPIAVVWGEYDFWIDEDFSHCGVNSIDFTKVDGAWQIANIMWTFETEGCPTKP